MTVLHPTNGEDRLARLEALIVSLAEQAAAAAATKAAKKSAKPKTRRPFATKVTTPQDPGATPYLSVDLGEARIYFRKADWATLKANVALIERAMNDPAIG